MFRRFIILRLGFALGLILYKPMAVLATLSFSSLHLLLLLDLGAYKLLVLAFLVMSVSDCNTKLLLLPES